MQDGSTVAAATAATTATTAATAAAAAAIVTSLEPPSEALATSLEYSVDRSRLLKGLEKDTQYALVNALPDWSAGFACKGCNAYVPR
jgi:hypothetical protein